jgi:multidrug resistance efflux pump
MSIATTPQLVSGAFTSWERVRTPYRVRRLAMWLCISLVLLLVALLCVPWQQTSRGTGNVIAFSPTERAQTVEAPIYGRVVRVAEGLAEGMHVEQGQFILEIRDVDTERAQRLESQVNATKDKATFCEQKVATYRRQVLDLQEAKQMLIEACKSLVAEAERKVDAELQGVKAAEAALAQTKSNYERQQTLFDAGVLSGTSLEKDLRSYEESQAKLKAAQAYVQGAREYLSAKKAELEQKSREAETKIDYARASEQEAQGEWALVRKELAEIEGKRAQFESRHITASRDGFLFRLFVNENAEMLKEGDPLFTIIPETDERAIELWVDGNDVPLTTPGREVRLQFEGWPALQFAAGWPHAALGTFGGEISSVDATDNGSGKFRVMVRPLPDEKWPEPELLRQGVRANGWVLLNQVTLGYELWRQINGFPAVYGDGSGKEKSGDKSEKSEKPNKKIKLPK